MPDQNLRHLDTLPDSALISIQTFAKLLDAGLSTTWRNLANNPDFPRTVKLGTRCTRVRLGDVRRLLEKGAA